MTYKEQLKKGRKVEKEHLFYYRQIKKQKMKTGRCPTDRQFTEGIAKAHIKEDKNYYDKLKKAKL